MDGRKFRSGISLRDKFSQTEKDCIRLLSGDISVADLVKEIVSRPAKAV